MTSLPRCALLLALLPQILGASPGPERWAIIDGWDIGFYPASQGCLAFASFDDTDFFIGYDTREDVPALDITVLDARWESIEADERYPVTLAFGNEPPWTLEMKGVHMDGAPGLHILIDASMEKSGTFIDEFQREMAMTWSYGDVQLGEFTLRGSRRAFEEVRACQNARSALAPVEAAAEIVPDD